MELGGFDSKSTHGRFPTIGFSKSFAFALRTGLWLRSRWVSFRSSFCFAHVVSGSFRLQAVPCGTLLLGLCLAWRQAQAEGSVDRNDLQTHCDRLCEGVKVGEAVKVGTVGNIVDV